MARGRPRKAGARRRDGRLVPAIDRGNARVQERAAAFAVFQGGKAGDQLADAIGRAWAAGLLDGTRIEASALRDAGRRYAELHARIFAASAVRTATLERIGRGNHAGWTGGGSQDPAGERYARLDALARDAGARERLALRKLCLTPSPDADPAWLARLIAARRAGAAPDPRDRQILDLAVRALLAMA